MVDPTCVPDRVTSVVDVRSMSGGKSRRVWWHVSIVLLFMIRWRVPCAAVCDGAAEKKIAKSHGGVHKVR